MAQLKDTLLWKFVYGKFFKEIKWRIFILQCGIHFITKTDWCFTSQPSTWRRVLKIDDFKTSKNNNLYSDRLFTSTSFPTRTILDCHPDYTQESLKGLTSFKQRSPFIVNVIQDYIIKTFKQNLDQDKTNNFEDKEILQFTEKMIISYDSGEMIKASIFVPWLNERQMDIEVSLNGAVSQ